MPSAIPRSIRIVGDVRCDEDLLIEGQVTGTIHVPGATLTIGADAAIAGEVRCARADLFGAARGTIVASQRIELAASAAVTGDLSADHVVLRDGARFCGRIDMNRRSMAADVIRFRRARGG